VLVVGCADQTPSTSTAASQPSATSTTVAPTTTTVPPMTAKELAWLKAIPKVRKKIDKSIETTSNLTISAMRNLATSLRSCSRELARGGAPSDRLQPVYALVKTACKEYDKGAACFTTAASIGIRPAWPALRGLPVPPACGYKLCGYKMDLRHVRMAVERAVPRGQRSDTPMGGSWVGRLPGRAR
jgi:hypothetical protein